MRGDRYQIGTEPAERGMSSTEKKHLGIALGVLTLAFAVSFSGGIRGLNLYILPFMLLVSFLSVGTAFVFHELAHRKLARSYGCWAEFRMWRWGLLMALLFSLWGFVFAAPGAVIIRGHVTRDQNGKISIVGPATNFAVGTGFMTATFFTSLQGMPIVAFILAFVAYVNLFIGGFNLLPFGPLDGRKIFSWNKTYYILLVVLIGGSLYLGYRFNIFPPYNLL